MGEEIYNYKYLDCFIDPETFEFTGDPGPSPGRKLWEYSLEEGKTKKADYFLYFANHGTYLIGFDRKEDTFTVWK